MAASVWTSESSGRRKQRADRAAERERARESARARERENERGSECEGGSVHAAKEASGGAERNKRTAARAAGQVQSKHDERA
eukprot:3041591-Rhodomonas_salina.2